MRTEEFFNFHMVVAEGCAKGIDEFLSTGTPYVSPLERREAEELLTQLGIPTTKSGGS
jgi:hypothetical protein